MNPEPPYSLRTRFTALVIALAGLSSSVPAADHTSTWNGSTGNWSDPTKWSTPTAPGTFPNNGAATYDAVQNNGSLTVDVPAGITLQKFSIGTGTLTATNNLTLNELLTFSAPGSQTSGESLFTVLNGAGIVTAAGGVNWSAASGNGPGISEISGANTALVNGRTQATDVINVTGGMTLHGNGVKRLFRRSLSHGDGLSPSTAVWSAGILRFSNNAVFTNKPAALFSSTFDGTLESQSGPNYFINQGTFTKTAGTGSTQINAVFDNSGTVNVNTGSLVLASGGTQTGNFNVSSGTTLHLGGSHVLNPGFALNGEGRMRLFSGNTTANMPLTFTGSSLELAAGTFTATQSLTLHGQMTISAPGSQTSGETLFTVLNGAGIVTAAGGVNWSAAAGNGPGISEISGVNTALVNGRTQATDVIQVAGGVTVHGAGVKSLNRRAMNHGDGVNPSTVTWSAGKFSFSNNAVFTNKPGAVFNNSFDGDLRNLTGTNYFINEGIFTKSAGTGNTDVAIVFENKGTVNVNAGTLRMIGGGSHTGTFNVPLGSTLQFQGSHVLNTGVSFTGGGSTSISGGTITANAPFTFAGSALNLTGGTLNGAGTIIVNSPTTWSAGLTIGGTNAATDQINISNSLSISGTQVSYQLTNRTLNTAGTTTWSTTSSSINNTGVINNTGTWLLTGSGSDLQQSGTFNNLGGAFFTKSAGAAMSVNQPFNNQTGATVTVSAGSLTLRGGGTQAGSFNVGGGAVLQFEGSHALNAGVTFSGAGITRISSGTTTANTALTFPNTLTLELSGGTLNGPGAITVNGPTTWSAGLLIEGTNATTDQITFNNSFTIGTSGEPRIRNRTVNTAGTTTWAGSNQFVHVEPGSVINNSGSWIATGSNEYLIQSGIFNNLAGSSFTKSGGDFHYIGPSFNNRVGATVMVATGALHLDGGGTQAGAFDIAAGATLRFAGGHALNAGVTFGGAGVMRVGSGTTTANTAVTFPNTLSLDLAGGALNGPGAITVNGPATWSAALLIEGTNATTDQITFNNSFTIGTSGEPRIRNRTVNTAGTTTWAGSNQFVHVEPGSVINNSGSWIATGSNEYLIQSGIFNNLAGSSFTKSGGDFHYIDPTFNNSGTVNGSAGTIFFRGPYTQTAGALVLNGGSVSGNGGTFVVRGGKIQGGGTISGGVTSSGGTVTIEPGIGTTTGTLAITGDLTLTVGSKLSFDIGGTTQHDKLTEGGGAALGVGGVTLEVNLLNGFIPAVGETITVVEASTSAITGNFANVLNGARLTLPGGLISCQVNYGGATAFPANSGSQKVILSHFATTPATLTLDDNQIVENAVAPKTVGLLGATDPDPTETFTFALTTVSGADPTDDDNGLFQISGAQLQAKSTTPLDFETKTSYKVRLRATNSRGGFREQAFTIQVQDVPAPTALALSSNAFEENQAIGSVVGALSATNPPGGGDPVTFTVVSVNGSITAPLAFAVNGGNLVTNRAFNFESPPNSLNVVVRATNLGGESAQQTFTVNVLDQGPSNLALSPSSILEGRPAGTTVGAFSATVVPSGTAVSYSLVSGTGSTHNAQFQIVGNALQTAAVPDFAAGATRSIRVRATGPATETVDQVFTITIVEAGPPTDLALSAVSIAENQPVNTVIGTLTATDPEPQATFTFALVDATNFPANARFNILGTSLRSSGVLDFETAPGPFSIRLRVTNSGGGFHEETVAITVTDQGPSSLTLSPPTIPEGRPVGTVVGTIAGTVVPEGTAISSVELASGSGDTDNALFSVEGTSLKTAAVLDFETAPTRSIRVKATDANGESFSQALTITVGDVGITDITLSGTTVLENVPAGTVIANLGAVINPADPGATPTFSIVSATPNDALTVTGNQLVTARPLLRSATPSISLRLRAEHLGEGYEEDVTITVNANAPALRPEKPPGTLSANFDLGDVVFGNGATASQTFTLRNAGPGHAFNVRFREPALSDFSLTSTALEADNDLAPGETAEVTITFTPQALGVRNVVLFCDSDGRGFFFTAIGRGIGAEISVQHPLDTELVDGAPLDFGAQPIGVTFPPRSFIVENVGTLTSLDSIAATITGPDADFFVLDTQDLVSSLTAGASRSFRLKFQPDALRRYNATLSIASTDANENPFDTPLTGEGVTPLMIAQMAYAKASDTGFGDRFGSAVAVSGDTVVLGATAGDGSAALVNSGTVHVLIRNPLTGIWSEQSILKASNADTGDSFGGSVAISGDTIVVGAGNEDSAATGINGNSSNNSASGSGAAYVFQRTGTTWAQQAYLKASNSQAGDDFGDSVAISGDTIVVGADDEDSAATGINGDGSNNSNIAAGAAYVFQRTGTTWAEQAYLKASNPGREDRFGVSVAISGDRVAVGAYQERSAASGVNGPESNNTIQSAGAVYLFERSSTTWTQQAYLKAWNPEAASFFGNSVALSGDRIVVGAHREDSGSTGINGNGENRNAFESGAAYVFQRSGNTWVQQAYLKASNPGVQDFFGQATALSGDTIVVGAIREDSNATGINGDGSNNNATDSGAAYIFEVTPQEVLVHDGPDTGSARLADNQTQAVNFGITLPGQQVTRAFTIQNVRALPLTVTGITAPDGYQVVAAPAGPLAPQDSATFFLHLTAAAPGTFSGPVTVSTNDSANPEFVFPVTGGVQNMTPGSLDLRFGTGGVVRADFNNSDDRAYAMTRLEDGRFVLAGRTTSGVLTDYAVLCLRPDGSVDPSFGDSGWTTGTVAGFPAAGISITGLAVKDGRILAAACPPGNDFISGAGQTFALMRLLPDGTPDTTFGTGGVALDGSATAAFTTGEVAFAASGKILVTGSLREGTNDRAYLRRFNQTGTVDTGFASPAGLLRLTNPGAGQCLVQNAAGEIFIGGRATTTGRLSLWKTSAGGAQLDVGTFPVIAPAGYPAEGAAPEFETVSALALQAAGKPVFAARRTAGLDRDTGHGFIAGQMSGTLDPDVTFAATGAVLTDLAAGVNKEQANSVAVQADGRVVVAGRAGDEIAVLRYLPNGLPDLTFGTAGRVMIPVGPGASAYKVFVDAAGDLYVAGHAGGPGANSQDFILLKLIGSNDQQPAIAVQRSSAPGLPAVTSGQAQPVEYGVTRVTSPKTTIFFVRNTGTAPLTISNVSVPTGYRVTFLNANIPAGGTGEIQIQLMAAAIGTFSGTVGINSNDPVLGTFTFPVTGQVLPNSAPVYTPLTIETVEGKPATLLLDKLFKQVTDADGDPVNLTTFSPISAKGAAIGQVEKSLVFTQPVPLAGTDSFEVKFSDGLRSLTGQVTVIIASDPGLNPKNDPTVTKLTDGSGRVQVSFSGIAGRNYSIQQTTDNVNFTPLGTATANRSGNVIFITPTAPPVNAKFRIRQI